MKRKTNLFHEIENAKFLTFSNYTELLTGNYLSVNTQLYPSRFLCLNIPYLTKDTKRDFVRYLCGYYENKLAFFRDGAYKNRYVQEIAPSTFGETYEVNDENTIINITNDMIHPLNILLNAIYKFTHNVNKDLNFDELGFNITYANFISETNYEGTYTDIVCIIDGSSNHTSCQLGLPSTVGINTIDYDKGFTRPKTGEIEEEGSSLYNWAEYNSLPDPYNWKNASIDNMPFDAIFDNDNINAPQYYTNDMFNEIELVETSNDIEFNILIPLFDVVTNDEYELRDADDGDLNSITNIKDALVNVPLGVWFADETISLKRDDSNYQPSWSLTIASQFKPFPYSKEIPDELSKENTQNAFRTFSKILYKQNELLNNISKFQEQIIKISNNVNELSARINNIATTDTVDGLKKQIIDLETKLNNSVSEVSQKVDSYVNELNWKVNS